MLVEKIDFHTHPWDARGNRIEEFLKEYEKKNYTHVGITNHYEFRYRLGRNFEQERREVEGIRKKYGMKVKVYISSEINCLDRKGSLDSDVRSQWLPELDYISAGPHHYNEEMIKKYGDNLLEDAKEMLLNLAERDDVKVILHPFIHIRDHVDLSRLPAAYLSRFAKLAKKHGKVIEIQRDMDERWLPLIEELMKCKVSLVVGSDAHSVTEIDDVKRAVGLIKKIDPGYPEIWLPGL